VRTLILFTTLVVASVRLTAQPASPAESDVTGNCPVQNLSLNTTVQKTLTSSCLSVEGSFYTDVYVFSGTVGQQVAITLRSSQIDSYLVLVGPDGRAHLTLHG
jgi:hypothetical protein